MKKVLFNFIIRVGYFGIGFFLGGKMLVGMINDYKMRMNRNYSNMLVLNDWLDTIYCGKNITDYFHNHGYNKIMIYGNGFIGSRLSQALAETDISVIAIMDKLSHSDKSGTVLGTESEIPAIDCIVVTPVFYYNEICDMLRKKTDVPIVSVQTIIENPTCKEDYII